ncbi:MAG: hypothetical protein JRD89_07100 [Deltaproteobacteria bacterium]|nr:hypothetical protein [Deltaproteobacteria bacterium]
MRSKYAELLFLAEEVGEAVAARVMAPRPAAPFPPPEPAPPEVAPPKVRYWEKTLPRGTSNHPIDLNMDARYFIFRTDRDIEVDMDLPDWSPITVPAAESPFRISLPEGTSKTRIYITAEVGANVGVLFSNQPIEWEFGRARSEGTAIESFADRQSYWYWASQIEQPAMSMSEWIVSTAEGVPYVVPEGKRLVIDLVTLSTDVAGVVQQVELLERKADGSLYRFGGAFFDCVVPLHLRVPIAAGSQVRIRTYNWDSDDRTIWVVIHGWEEWL